MFKTNYYCPCCRSDINGFINIPYVPVIRSCPLCGSHERHRLLLLFFEKYTNIFKNKKSKTKRKLLHFAPFHMLKFKFQRLSDLNYITADLIGSDVDVNIDITKIQFKANTFDIILCIHVLEHLENDIKALLELYRILKPGGWAILQVPIDKSLKKNL